MQSFPAWVVRRAESDGGRGAATASLETLDSDFLDGLSSDDDAGSGPMIDTVVRVEYSSVNYKDALALTGRPGVVRRWPLVPGIDATGVVIESHGPWRPGDVVTLNGAGLGESLHGGLAGRAHVEGSRLVAVPPTMSARQAAAIGTAGFTAMLSVLAIERHGVTPQDGPVLVTGASGGVGSIAVSLLAHAGFEVTASTGRVATQSAFLTELGATDVIDRAELAEAGKPMQTQRWAAVVDAVGGPTLVNAVAQLRHGGVAAACGLAQSADYVGTVLPYILRGVTLAGINSVEASGEERRAAWDRLESDVDLRLLDGLTSVVPLSAAREVADRVLAGGVRGRTVVEIGG
ncbi:acrylyl-CoA reductase (NADPH) [Labedella gwakjiensis]|uniref:Acrylyl-CoA reductase (NADPH) n=1 Tax=Labedella gwakjiensis TaxID=390269 RepID=A0A2P8GVX1_9MICO|nr:MDR family oxidoreductase [Labedella gwakjiensis]PSL38095.1 acrylyl-CoA reductase (NADPH) [Labedella gwakjiensis]RUQ87352.1 oxidoreductase [Labedella gwakjiensis]